MANETLITIIGNLTGDPELKYTPNGAPVVNFTIASTPRIFDRQSNQFKDGDTLFMRCSAWRDYAEHIAESLSKGMQVIAHGELKQRSYETKEGEKRTVVELKVEDVGPTLRFATAKVTRAQRKDSGNNSGGSFSQPAQQSAPVNDPWSTDAQGGQAPFDEAPPF